PARTVGQYRHDVGVVAQGGPVGDGPVVQRGAPVPAVLEHRQVDLRAHRVGDRFEDVVLGAEVVVERGPADPQFRGEAAGGDGREALGVHQRTGGRDDPVGTQKG